MIIGIDVDDVLLDMVPEWLSEYAAYSGERIRLEQVTDWAFSCISPEHKEAFYGLRTPEMYSRTRPIEGAITAVRELAAQGHFLVAITHDGPEFVEAKRRILASYFPEITQIVVAKDKNCVKVDLLIDDAPHNVEAAECEAVLFDRPWNRKYKPKNPRVWWAGWDWKRIMLAGNILLPESFPA